MIFKIINQAHALSKSCPSFQSNVSYNPMTLPLLRVRGVVWFPWSSDRVDPPLTLALPSVSNTSWLLPVRWPGASLGLPLKLFPDDLKDGVYKNNHTNRKFSQAEPARSVKWSKDHNSDPVLHGTYCIPSEKTFECWRRSRTSGPRPRVERSNRWPICFEVSKLWRSIANFILVCLATAWSLGTGSRTDRQTCQTW